jgi:hypothetical protein
VFSFLVGMSAGLMATGATAGTINLADGNSAVTINTTSGSLGQAGLSGWTVNGVSQLPQQWFWYRIGSGTQASIDTLGNEVTSGTASSPRSAYLTYSGSNGLSVEIDYLLTGSPAGGQSDLSQTIRLTNNSSAAQTVHFYEYSDFVLQGVSGAQTLQFPNVNDVMQTYGGSSMSMVLTPTAGSYQGSADSTLLTSLTGSGPTTLLDSPSLGSPLPGNVNYAYEWDPTIQPGGSFIISNDQQVSVPEPSTLVVLGAGAVGLLGCAWRRRRRKAA